MANEIDEKLVADLVRQARVFGDEHVTYLVDERIRETGCTRRESTNDIGKFSYEARNRAIAAFVMRLPPCATRTEIARRLSVSAEIQ